MNYRSYLDLSDIKRAMNYNKQVINVLGKTIK